MIEYDLIFYRFITFQFRDVIAQAGLQRFLLRNKHERLPTDDDHLTLSVDSQATNDQDVDKPKKTKKIKKRSATPSTEDANSDAESNGSA